jgi:hypothetical protein
MSTHRPPHIDIRFADLPSDASERHEVLVDLFGRYLFWLRNWTVGATRDLAKSEEARSAIGAVRRKKYDDLATLTSEQQDIACKISEATVDRFIQLFLTMLSNTGVDQRIGDTHAIRFRLDIEICDVENADVVEAETINRGGKRLFADYWGRWLNQFPSQEPRG